MAIKRAPSSAEKLFLQDAPELVKIEKKPSWFSRFFGTKKTVSVEKRFTTLLKEYVERVAKAGSHAERVALRADDLYDRVITVIARKKNCTDTDWKVHLQAAKKLIVQELQNIDPAQVIALPLPLPKDTVRTIEKTFQDNIGRAFARLKIVDVKGGKLKNVNTRYFNPSFQQENTKIYARLVKRGVFTSVDAARRAFASVLLESVVKNDMHAVRYEHNGVEIEANDVEIVRGNNAPIYTDLTTKQMTVEERAQEYIATLPTQVPQGKSSIPVGDQRKSYALYDQIVEEANRATDDKQCKKALAEAQKMLDKELAQKKVASSVRTRVKKEFQTNIARAVGRKQFEGAKDPRDLRAFIFMPANQRAMQKKQQELVTKGFFRNVAEAHAAMASAFAERALMDNLRIRDSQNVVGLNVDVRALKIRNAHPLQLFGV